MSRIMYEILPAVILTLLYTSMYSDGITLEPNGSNPVVGYPFEIVCNTEVTISNTVAIKIPDGTVVGSCDPAFPPIIRASCIDAVGYDATLNELTQTVTLNINNLTSDVNGTWTCTHNSVTGTWPLPAPITDIKEKRVSLNPTSFPETITSQTSISLTVTYECINIPVHFTWFAVDNSSQKNPLDVANTAEKNSSLCKSYPGFYAYTQTYSTSSVKDLDRSYRIGVEVHYSGEVTALQSIQYFDTYFIFSPPTTTSPSTDETTPEKTNGSSKYSSRGTNTPTGEVSTAIGILTGCLFIADIIVMVALCIYIRSTGKTSGNCFLTFCQFIKEHFFDCCASGRIQKNSLLGFTYLVIYGVIVEVIVLLAVYYGYSEFQEGLVIGVGFVIVLVLSGLCLLVVWMLKKFFINGEDGSRMNLDKHDELQQSHEHQMPLREVERKEEDSD